MNDNNINLLIIADSFPPAFAPRVGFLCKNLRKHKGWNVIVAAEQVEGTKHGIDIGDVKAYCHKFIKSNNKFLAKAEWTVKFVMTMAFDYKSLWFYRKIRKDVKDKKIDAVICSTYSTFPLKSAQKIAIERCIPMIADLRDIAEQSDMSLYKSHKLPSIFGIDKWLYKRLDKLFIKRRNKIIRYADAVTSVSNWHVNFLKKHNENVHLIYNGYDSEMFKPKQIKNGSFDIVYTGRIGDIDFQSPDLFFKAVKQLMTDKKYNHILIKWYVDEKSKSLLEPEIKRYNLNNVNDFMTTVNYSEIPNILAASSICLVLTNKTGKNGPHGVMTTKFFEALGCERPVLCVRSDEGCLEEAINTTKAGIAARTVEEVVDFIKAKYEQWLAEGCTTQEISQAEKEKFCRERQAEQFAELVESLRR